MGASVTPRPDVLALLRRQAGEAIAAGADPARVNEKYQALTAYFRQFPKMAEDAADALEDGADVDAIAEKIWPHAHALSVARAPLGEDDAHEGSDSLLGAAGRSLAATGANIAQGIPGMEAAQAGARALVRRQPYREALGDIRGETAKIPTPLRVAERVAGAVPLARFLPKNPAGAGAIVGGAGGALAADADQSAGERTLNTVVDAGLGAGLGKVLDVGVTGLRTLAAKPTAQNILERVSARAESAKDLFGRAFGGAAAPTDAVKRFVANPKIQDIIAGLREEDPALAELAPESPRMLDAVYKVLSDQSRLIKKNLDAPNPNKPNLGRFRGRGVEAAQQELLKAAEAPGSQTVTMAVAKPAAPTASEAVRDFWSQTGEAARRAEMTPMQRSALQALDRRAGESAAPRWDGGGPREIVSETPATMPDYRPAVQDYAARSAGIDAVKRGARVLKAEVGATPNPDNLAKLSAEGLESWAAGASPAEREAASQGVLGATRAEFGRATLTKGRKAVTGSSPDLLRRIGAPSQQKYDYGQLLAILTALRARAPLPDE